MLVIREATPADAELVYRLTLAAYAEYRDTLVPASGVFRESLESVRAQIVTDGAIIARLGAEPVACGRYELDPAGVFLYFGRLSVLPSFRRRGIAARLIAWFEQRAAALGLAEVRLGVRLSLPSNISLYTALGYAIYAYEDRRDFGRVSAWMRRRVLPVAPGAATGAGAVLALFGGPAGSGKSTLAAAWCAERPRAAHIELDRMRDLIAGGRADPQEPGALAAAQYRLSVDVCMAAAHAFLTAGYDVAIDDVLEPEAFREHWSRRLDGLDWRLVIVRPTLDATLARSAARTKRVREEHIRAQHARTGHWPEPRRVDTTGLSVTEGLEHVRRVLEV